MKNKGFTLVELLACLIVLALLSLIIVPAVMDIISDTKESTNKRNIENYISALKVSVTDYQVENGVTPSGSYSIKANQKFLDNGRFKIDLNIQGEGLESGTVFIDEDGSIKLYYASDNGKLYNYKNSTIIELNDETINFIEKTNSRNVTVGNIPQGAFEKGDEYIIKVSDNWFHFFILSENEDGTINLIMQANLSDKGVGIFTDDNRKGYGQLTANDNTLANGRNEAISKLKSMTSSWINVVPMDMYYDEESLNSDLTYSNSTYIDLHIVGNARLPMAHELVDAGCSFVENSCPNWLTINLSQNQVAQGIGSAPSTFVRGYYTLSSNNNSDLIVLLTKLNKGGYTNSTGIRPVITLSKEILLKAKDTTNDVTVRS